MPRAFCGGGRPALKVQADSFIWSQRCAQKRWSMQAELTLRSSRLDVMNFGHGQTSIFPPPRGCLLTVRSPCGELSTARATSVLVARTLRLSVLSA